MSTVISIKDYKRNAQLQETIKYAREALHQANETLEALRYKDECRKAYQQHMNDVAANVRRQQFRIVK